MKNFFYNYFYTGSAALIFFALALFDLVHHETDPRNQWDQSWELMSVFGKVDAILCGLLMFWTFGVIIVKYKYK